MKNSKVIGLVSVLAVAGYLITMNEGTVLKEMVAGLTTSVSSNFEFVKETDYPIVAGHASMAVYSNLEELRDNAVLIAEVKIKDQKTVYLSENPPSVETWSEVDIKEVYKGDSNLKKTTITEFGGVIDMSKSKGNEMRSDGAPIKSEPFIEDAVEGSPVMKKGNSYVVFLKEGYEKGTYTIVGTVQGKIRIDDASNKGVVTIEPEHFAKHMDLFWFQRKFAGKDRSEIAQTLKHL